MGESIRPRTITAIAQSVDGRPGESVIVLGEEEVQVGGIILQDVVVGSALYDVWFHRSMGDDVLAGRESCLEADGNVFEEVLGGLSIIVVLKIYVHPIKVLFLNDFVELVDYGLLPAVAVLPAVVVIAGPRSSHAGTAK